jgi:aminopeptidase N
MRRATVIFSTVVGLAASIASAGGGRLGVVASEWGSGASLAGAWHGAEWEHLGCLHCRMLAAGAEAQALPTEPGTGRNLRNYAPDRPADFKHMKLEFDIPDMNRPEMAAKQTLTFTPIAAPLAELNLNAEQLKIESVEIPDSSPLAGAHRVTPSHDGSTLTLVFDPPLPPGADGAVVVRYRVNDPADGLTWTPETAAWAGRPAQIHTQGQPETNRYWFPAHDSPNERMTTEIVATVPEGFIVSANGREVEPPRTSGGRTTFHWLQDTDHVAYLVSMIVGKFDVRDVAPAGSAVPMPVYVPPGKGDLIEGTYGRTPEMVRVFERLFDEPYPFDRYAQLVVWNFGAGGMENTSATTMFDTAILSEKALEDDDLDGLISHELGHQWFGDLITCNSWAHIWLNEGWATYCTALWFEARDGAQDGYLRQMHQNLRGVAENDQLAPGAPVTRPGMVSPIYKHPWEVFRRVSNPYPKGASILHMLRKRLGDEVFFKGVHAYVDRYKHKTVETADFRRVMEEVSGQGLDGFFDQWCFRPGTPDLRVSVRYRAASKQVAVTLEQKQLIDDDHPAYEFDLPIEIYTEASPGATPIIATLHVSASRHELLIDVPAEPAMVLIDPDLAVLSRIDVDAPVRWLTNQLWTTRSIASRLDAAKFLKNKAGPEAVAALARRVSEADNWSVRAAAARALGDLYATRELAAALSAGIDHPKARLAAIRALGAAGGDEAVELLAKHAANENESYACRAAALEWLGRRAPRGSTSHLPIFEAALRADSQHEQVRSGALEGLAALGAREGFDMAVPFTRDGNLSRLRPIAITASARLADPANKAAALALIEPLLTDREDRARHAAIDALVELEDPRGLEMLSRVADTSRNVITSERAEAARARLVARLASRDAAGAAQGEIDRLRNDLKRLETRVKESGASRSDERKGDARE